MKSSPDFRSSGRDSLPRFAVFFFVFGAGCLPIPFIIYDGFGMYAVTILFAMATLLAIGLRFSIAVSSGDVLITRSWFGIPYWYHKGHVIYDVFYGGDWGDAEGASGVVVKLDGRELHIGSGSTMYDLHAALLPFVTTNRERTGNGGH